MTSQGSAYARLRRALDSGNVTIALAAAADMPALGLTEALELCLLLLDQSQNGSVAQRSAGMAGTAESTTPA